MPKAHQTAGVKTRMDVASDTFSVLSSGTSKKKNENGKEIPTHLFEGASLNTLLEKELDHLQGFRHNLSTGTLTIALDSEVAHLQGLLHDGNRICARSVPYPTAKTP